MKIVMFYNGKALQSGAVSIILDVKKDMEVDYLDRN